MKKYFRLLLLAIALPAQPMLMLGTSDVFLTSTTSRQPSLNLEAGIAALEKEISILAAQVAEKKLLIREFTAKVSGCTKNTQRQCAGDLEYIQFCKKQIQEHTADYKLLQSDLAQMRKTLKDFKHEEKLQKLLLEADAELEPIMAQYSESLERLKNYPAKQQRALGFLDATKALIMDRYNHEKDKIIQEYDQTP